MARQNFLKIDEQRLGERMLSGEPFTYGMLCASFSPNDDSRIIDGTIQKFRKKGLISFERRDGRVFWTATTEGMSAAARGVL